MNINDKTREELLAELEFLRQENISLKASYKTEIQEITREITERKLIEQALRESEARFRSYFELPLIGIAITSPEKGWIEANEGIKAMLGYTMEELSNLSWAELTYPDDLAADVEQFNKVISDRQNTYFLEKRFICKNGAIIWTNLSVGCLRKADRSVDYMVALIQNITERKKAENELLESKERFQSLFDNMIDGSALHTLVYDDQGVPEDYRILDVNPAFEAMLGISRETVVNKTSRLAYGVDVPPYFEIYAKVALTGNPEVFETYFAPLDKHFSISVYCPYKGSFVTVFDNITKRKKAEHDLRVILTKYQVLFEILPIGITISDSAGNIIESNEIAQLLLGISREEQENRKIDAQEWQIIRPDGSPMPTAEFASVKALESGAPVTNVVMGIVKAKNQITWINVSATPIPIEDYGVAIVYNDITERRQAEIENEKTQKLLEDSQRVGKIGGWEVNIDTLELKWTREMYNIHEVDLSFTPKVDQRVNFYTPESLPLVDKAVKNAIENGESYEIDSEIITAKGNRKSVRAIGRVDIEKQRIYGLFQDITDRKLAEQALKESEEKYRNLFEKSQIGMFRTRMDGSKVLDVNEKLLQTLGYTYEEMVNNPSTIRYANAEQREELIKILQQNGSVTNFEIDIVGKNNTIFTSLMSVISYPEEGILEGSFVDITDRKLAEEALKTSEVKLIQLNATKDKFFSIIAHDLKSPFSGILGFSGMLKKEARNLDIESIVKYTDFIHSSAQQTFKLLENLLDWARMNQGSISFEPKAIIINNLIKNEIESLKYISDQKNITITNNSNQGLIITADEKMLSTVIRNLISNAIKFTPKNGKVDIEVKKKDGEFEISVSDTGIGMEKETIGQLFKIETSFSTRGTENEKGTGLGLLLCKEFIEKHRGKVWVESEIGKGSRFIFSIPFRD